MEEVKSNRKRRPVPQKVTIAKIPRAKKKYVTRVCGLATFGKAVIVGTDCPNGCHLYFHPVVTLLLFCDPHQTLTLRGSEVLCSENSPAVSQWQQKMKSSFRETFTDDIIDVIQEKWPEVSEHPRSSCKSDQKNLYRSVFDMFSNPTGGRRQALTILERSKSEAQYALLLETDATWTQQTWPNVHMT